MSDLKQAAKTGDERIDMRTLWLPASAWIAALLVVGAGLVGSGMWLQRTNDRTATTTDLSADMRAVNDKLSTMQGSINALMQMQGILSQTQADVGAIKVQLSSMETKIQTQDAWIQRLRDDLRREGINPPPYNRSDRPIGDK